MAADRKRGIMNFKYFKELINSLPDDTETVSIIWCGHEYIFDVYYKDTPLEVETEVMSHFDLRFE